MPGTFEKVTEQALTLPGSERLRLARQLLESVQPEATEEIERAWEEEIERRIAKVDSGKAKGRPWAAIKKEFHSRYGR